MTITAPTTTDFRASFRALGFEDDPTAEDVANYEWCLILRHPDGLHTLEIAMLDDGNIDAYTSLNTDAVGKADASDLSTGLVVNLSFRSRSVMTSPLFVIETVQGMTHMFLGRS